MGFLLVVSAFVVAIIVITISYRRIAASIAEKENQKQGKSAPMKTSNMGSGAGPTGQVEKYLQPSVISGRIRRTLAGSKIYARSTRRWSGDRIDQPAMPEGVVKVQRKLDDFLNKKGDMRVLTPIEMRSLIESTEDRCQPLILTACYAGLTANELLGLLWEDIDFERSLINVRRIYYKGKFYETSRDVAKRSVIVPAAVIDALKEHRQQQEKNNIKTACYFVFTNSTGEALSKELLEERIFELAKRRAGLKNITFDDLRYSYATALLSAGESLAFVKRQLGYQATMEETDGQEPIPPEEEQAVSKRLALDLGITLEHRKAS